MLLAKNFPRVSADSWDQHVPLFTRKLQPINDEQKKKDVRRIFKELWTINNTIRMFIHLHSS